MTHPRTAPRIGDQIAAAARTLASRKKPALGRTIERMLATKTASKPVSEIEELFARHVRAEKLPVPVREHRFHPTRRWRFDFAWPELRIAVEVEGGTWSGGRHTRGSGFEADCEKYNAAAILGWRVLRVTGGMVKDGTAIAAARAMLQGEALRGTKR